MSAKQTISAKRTIHLLNKESVEAMVALLKLNDTTMSPDELVTLIKTKRTDGNLLLETEVKIKEVVYIKKLYAIKRLVLLLHMKREDIDLPLFAPKDLIDVLFTPNPEALVAIQQSSANLNLPIPSEGEFPNEQSFSQDFFCMPCFHKAYTAWKLANGIQ